MSCTNTNNNCPTSEPCSEVFDAQCVIYTGANILCDNNVLVSTNDTINDVVQNITDFVCGNSGDTPGETQIQIPQLNIQSQNKLLFASIFPGVESNLYLSYNPTIFLFVKKNGKAKIVRDINDDKEAKYYFGGWHHTTHMQGINFPNSNFYSGDTVCKTYSEFPLIITQPYERQKLKFFNPGEFYVYKPNGNSQPAPLDGSVLWNDLPEYYVRGRKRDGFTRSVYFRFAIGIENPDTTSKYPIIFGPLTASIQCKIVREKNPHDGNSYVSYALNHDPTNIKHFKD